MGMNFNWGKTFKLTVALLVVSNLSSCLPTSSSGSTRRKTSSITSTKVDTPVTKGKVLTDNPVILSGNSNLSVTADLNSLASVAFITTDTFLHGNANCDGLEYCFEVRETKDSASALQTSDGKWGYNVHTEEFLQVNAYYHLTKIFDQFFENLSLSRAYSYLGTTPYYDTAIPQGVFNYDGTYVLSDRTLTAYSNCDIENNAFFDRSNETLCFGYSNPNKKLRWAQDSTIIYHEAGHYFQKLQINLRNYSGAVVTSDLGSLLYDEAGAIGEGLADFFSYYVNGRTHWGEWAAGKISSSRPLSEDDSLHAPGITTDNDQRLSYPQYINYDPNAPEAPVEDIHQAGMITSHYLVALSKDIQAKCGFTQSEASMQVMHLVTETLAELGDMTTVGTLTSNVAIPNKVNLNSTYAYDWLSTVNPINYRGFAQTMAKNIKNTLGNPLLSRCNGSYYQKDYIESLLDDYGLLLFKTYNEHRNLADGTTKTSTAITATNRKKSILIPKSALILDPTAGASSAFVIDSRADMLAAVQALQSSGVLKQTLSQQTPSDLGFNNNNSKVSPGEVVGLALNLYNNSNSQMGGIQILANDWNHVDSTTGKPFQFPASMSNDQWPLVSEGGVAFDPNSHSIQASSSSDFAPVCFIQYNDSTATKWITQKEYMQKLALDNSLCLNPGLGNEKDCFFRALKGADQARFSKINPKSTWGQTMADPTSGEALGLGWGNVILFEVSKHIPPGTIIDCRLRLRFTNCDDCYHDSSRSNYDYKDVDYNGPKPFKILHLQIPITD
jgi:hypothetical protein